MKNFLFTALCLSGIFFNVCNAQHSALREGVTIPTLEINLYARAMNGSMFFADGVLQNFNNDYSAAVDNMDVRKFMNATDNLAIKNGDYNLIVERRPGICIADTLQLMLTGTRVAPYRFEIDPSVLNSPNLKAFLVDNFLKFDTPVSLTTLTYISFNITADPASKAANRFMIVYRMQDPVRFTAISAVRNLDNSISTTFKTENENNVNNYAVENSTDGINFEPIASQLPTANNFGNPYYNYTHAKAKPAYNWYRIKANLIAGAPIYSSAAKADIAFVKQQHMISVFPNPITDCKINITIENQPLGVYKLSIINSAGQIIFNENISVQASQVNKIISKPGMHAGIYSLILEGKNGQIKAITLLVK